MTGEYQWRVITPHVWQIPDEKGVCSTLIQGRKLAILLDTGFGNKPLRAFVESHVTTPYMVINTHAHPDHSGGNGQFSTVHALAAEMDNLREFMPAEAKCQLRALTEGQVIDLGGVTAEVVSLAGHTRGSMGLLLREERLLLSGDAISEYVWLFGPGSMTLPDLRKTILRILPLPFDQYLGGHMLEAAPKQKILTHLRHMEQLDVNRTTPGEYHHIPTLKSVYADELGRSVFVFDSRREANWKPAAAESFRLGIIEESLEDPSLLEDLAEYFVAQRVEEVPDDAEPVWHVNEYQLPEETLLPFLDRIKDSVKPTWYVHAFTEERLYVALRGRWFRLNPRRDESWADMIRYGEEHAQVERRYLESIPLSI